MNKKELLDLIKTKTEEVRAAMKENDSEKAESLMNEIRSAKRNLKIIEEIDESDMDELRGKHVGTEKRTGLKAELFELRAAVKYVLTGQLSDEERAAVNIEKNAAILPEQFVNDIQVLREGFPSLKQHCHIVRATSNHGKMPFAKIGGKKLTKYKSGTKLTGETANTEHVTYDIENYGSLVPVAQDLQEDEAINIINDVIKPDFAEASVNTENGEILTIVETKATDKSAGVTDWRGIKKVIDGVLPTLKGRTIVITNMNGYVYLKSQEDKQGRNLELVKSVNGKDYFENKQLITLSNEDLKPTTDGNQIFYVVNLYALVKFFERKGYTLSVDHSVFFESDEDALKVQERFDVEALDNRADFKIEFAEA